MESKKVKSHWNERWKFVITDLPTRNTYYYISDYGRIKSVDKESKSERIIKGSKGSRGLRTLSVKQRGGPNWSCYIHKFVAQSFVPKPSEDHIFPKHIDGDKSNNHYKNLIWITKEELHQQFSETMSNLKRGNPKGDHVKLTESKVRLLKQRLKEGKTKKKILARSFNISYMQLNRIERGENWGHVTLDDED